MYPSSPISSSTNNLFHIPLSPSMQYDYEFFQYFHDHQLLQPSQSQFLTTPTPDHHQNNNLDNTNMEKEEDSNNKVKEGFIKNKKSRSRGSASKKDRHSKINTAQGPRDRRMRLSLDVARKFFNLQDLLGFDKASKTVEWLLNKSNSAVKELEEGTISTAYICGAISASASTSECEVISSEIIDESAITQQQQTVTGNNKGENNNKKKAKAPRARAAIVHPFVGKESRNQARARARERTLKKSLNNIGHESSVINSGADDLKRLGSWTPFEDQSGNITKENVVVENSNLVVTSGNWPSPLTTIFNNYHHNTEISHEHQWKLWEA